ncbi:conserved hypothetical protein [Dehalogenimonas lykanthroporepellens BL-DC-9]|nr:conserved hypothetical protein [Dehalogenimonas lykanthroporepellens BL-DC-9]
MLKAATLISFDSLDYTADIRPDGSPKAYLDGITVARHIPVAEMLPGRRLAVLFPDRYQAGSAVIIAVWEG